MTLARRAWTGVALLGLLAGGRDHAALRAAEAPAERVTLGVVVQEAAACPGAVLQGACVSGLRPDSAAARAGLAAGDVIQQLDQTPVTAAATLVAAVRGLQVGQDVEITYLRAGEVRRSRVLIQPGDRAVAGAAASVFATLPPQGDPCDRSVDSAGVPTSALPFRKQPLAMERQALERLLGKETAAIALQADVLTLAFRAPGGSARAAAGSIQCALARVEDADVWALQLRMAQWEQAFLSVQFIAIAGQPSRQPMASTMPTATANAIFRGSKAPPSPAVVAQLRGKLSTTTVPSERLGTPREVSVYLPPGGARAKLPVLYMTDGQGLPSFAPIVEAQIQAGRIRPIAIVAEHAGRYTGDTSKPMDPRLDDRARDYLPEVDPPRFASHMRFFVEELLPWAEQQYGLSTARSDRAAMGYSNGGAFVGQLGMQHPESFATVLPFSPAWRVSTQGELRSDPARLPRFLFSGGELEPTFLASARVDAAWLAARGVSTQLRTWWSGHDTLQWQQALAEYLPLVFAPSGK
jgi:enterochelin esterase-like enzyme